MARRPQPPAHPDLRLPDDGRATSSERMNDLFTRLGELDLDTDAPDLVTLDGDEAGEMSRTASSPAPTTDEQEAMLDIDEADVEAVPSGKVSASRGEAIAPVEGRSNPPVSRRGSLPSETATRRDEPGREPAALDPTGLAEARLELDLPPGMKGPGGGSSGPAAPSAPSPAPMRSPSPPPSSSRRGPWLTDVAASRLFAAAIGLGVSVIPASMAARHLARADVEPRLIELEDAIDRPLAVRAGNARAPRAIAQEIEAAQDRVSTRFWGVWLVLGVPLGLALGFVRRG